MEATAEHPFWLEGRGWVGAGELVPGQRVLRADGRWLRVEGVEARGGAQTVYNLEVEDWHTYVVGNLGAWVHNACGDVFKTVMEEGGVKIVEATTKSGVKLEVAFEEIREGTTMTLRGAHVQGAQLGAVGPKELLDLVRQYAKEQGMTRVIVEGARRTTSSMKGRVPRPWVLDVE